MNSLSIEGKELVLTNLEKVFWPELNLTKADLINYYIKIANYILPYLKDRPFSMKPFPDGIKGKSFYQKQCPKEAPDWLQTTPIYSKKKGYVDWCLINDLPSLVWIANRACIEMHTWFSKLPDLNKPDMAVLDLDPSGNIGFRETVVVAKIFKIILDELNLFSIPKTSGATGIHIYIPIKQKYKFSEVRYFLLEICKLVEKFKPDLATTERNVKKRGNKVYLDAVQNSSGKTVPAPYSLRPTPEATVSTPIFWEELDKDISPKEFNIFTIFGRLNIHGDLFQEFFTRKQNLPTL